MRGVGVASTALFAASLFARSVFAQSLPAIEIKGSKFFYSNNGSQFFIKGVAYQQDIGQGGSGVISNNTQYNDPLANPAACQRDIPYLLQLQTNTIRVYAIDPTQDHSQCMQMMANAGIYVVADLSAPVVGESINRDSPSWNTQLYSRFTSVIDVMANYTNTLGFFAGNEVTNADNNTDASAFVKAAVRDMKAYIRNKNYRSIGVGYATDDDQYIRENIADYLNCDNTADGIDFLGYNIYSWCGTPPTYATSGYQARTQFFANYSVPVFFAEYGCITQGVRTFLETAALYGPDMSPVWSGGIVYMYFQESNNYGLVSLVGSSISTLQDFTNLKTAIASVSPSSIAMTAYTPTNTALAACPTIANTWQATATPLPPTPNANLCTCMDNAAGCVVAGSVGATDYGNLFGLVCGANNAACNGILANGTTGQYGAFAMCDSAQQLDYVLNQYAVSQSNNPSACAWSGSATTKPTTSAAGSCASLLNQVGTAGTGTVSSPGATGSAKSSGTQKAAANALFVPGFGVDLGFFSTLAYLGGAVLTGAGMILL